MFIDKNGNLRRPVAYLADFEMFLPTCEETVKYWKETCEKYGIIGLFPGEKEPDDEFKPYTPKDDSPKEKWYAVFMHDVNHMKRSDMVIAQLEDWRGAQPDSGTAFEVGYIAASGKPCYGFLKNSSSMIDRTCWEKKQDADGVWRDPEGYAYEDRGIGMDNIFAVVKLADTFEDACKLARADFDAQLVAAGLDPWTSEE